MSETSLVQHVTNIEAGDSVVACAFLGRTPVYALADGTLLYAGIGEEKRVNPRVAGRDRAAFIELMAALNLPRPKKLDVAVPANRACGKVAPIQAS